MAWRRYPQARARLRAPGCRRSDQSAHGCWSADTQIIGDKVASNLIGRILWQHSWAYIVAVPINAGQVPESEFGPYRVSGQAHITLADKKTFNILAGLSMRLATRAQRATTCVSNWSCRDNQCCCGLCYWSNISKLAEPIIAAGQPAEACWIARKGFLADPECQQRAEDQAKRATKRRANANRR